MLLCALRTAQAVIMLVLLEAVFASDINQIVGSVETDWSFDFLQIVARVALLQLTLCFVCGCVQSYR